MSVVNRAFPSPSHQNHRRKRSPDLSSYWFRCNSGEANRAAEFTQTQPSRSIGIETSVGTAEHSRNPAPDVRPITTRLVHGVNVGNVLLQQIPQSEFLKIKPHLQPTKLEIANRLEEEGTPLTAVYFLNGGIASMIVETSDGRSVEVGVAGREDMVGLALGGA